MSVFGIIPARYGSSRFPGKPLHLIGGKTLLQHTYENAKKCRSLEELIIATDDERIFRHAQELGAHVVMTSPDCATGTDRLKEVAETLQLGDDSSIFLNIQGDMPSVESHVLDAVAEALIHHPQEVMATAVIPIKEEKEAFNTSVVKCVLSQDGHALYFSRGLIPHSKSGRFSFEHVYFHHLGIYAYRRPFLLHYSHLKATPLMLQEDLEQLKVLEHGFPIKVAIVESSSFGVDTLEDAKRLEEWLWKQNMSLSQEESAPPSARD